MLTFLLNALVVILIFALPRLMMELAKKVTFLNILGPVLLCYACGFLLSFILPVGDMAATMSELLVPLAIPLILFSCNVLVLKKLAGRMLKSFSLNIVAVLVICTLAYFLFRNNLADADKLSAMLTGLYTGGTPNMMAIGLSLGIVEDQLVLVNTADLIAGGIYYLLVLSVFIPLFGRILPRYQSAFSLRSEKEEQQLLHRYLPDKNPITRQHLKKLTLAVLLAIACLGVSAGIALLLTGTLHVAIVMLCITTLGVAFSFNKRIRNCPGTYNTGQYLIYMFSVAIGMSFNFSALSAGSMILLALVLLVQFGTVLLHLLLAYLCKVDSQTMIITSIAGIFGPAFIPPTANALKNDELLLPGLACGILGYGIGNYLGLAFAWILGVF